METKAIRFQDASKTAHEGPGCDDLVVKLPRKSFPRHPQTPPRVSKTPQELGTNGGRLVTLSPWGPKAVAGHTRKHPRHSEDPFKTTADPSRTFPRPPKNLPKVINQIQTFQDASRTTHDGPGYQDGLILGRAELEQKRHNDHDLILGVSLVCRWRTKCPLS